jgi:hypothetical protein
MVRLQESCVCERAARLSMGGGAGWARGLYSGVRGEGAWWGGQTGNIRHVAAMAIV